MRSTVQAVTRRPARSPRRLLSAATAILLGVGLLGPVNPLAPANPAAATPVNQVQWRPVSGAVNAVTVGSNGTQYLGGTFTSLAVRTGKGAVLNASTGVADRTFPYIDDTINVVVPDGSGGWYVGGMFTKVGRVAQGRLAHLNADGSLDRSWSPVLPAGTIVYALAVDGNTLYVGGTFTTVNGQSRNRLAAFSLSTGALTAWNPNASDVVRALAVSGSTVYVGGDFNGANAVNGSTTRNRLAAFDATTGVVTGWDPNANGLVRALAVSGSTVYVGGDFNGANAVNGSTTRNRLAAFDATTGVVTGWDPNATSAVRALVVSGSGSGLTVYAGGNFNGANAVNGTVTRNYVAAFDAAGVVTAWNPNVNSTVLSLALSGSTVVVGGGFTTVNQATSPLTRNYLAAFDTAGVATGWNPNLDNLTYALAVDGSMVYAGGSFASANATTRNRLAALDSNGDLTTWNPNVTGTVYSLAVSGSTVYAGGAFNGANSVNGNTTRNRLAAFDATTGTVVSAWNPNVSAGTDGVTAIAVSNDGNTLYIGGDFTQVGGVTSYARLVAVATTGAGTPVSTWLPAPDAKVNVLAMSADGSTLYVGGGFTTVGGQSRSRLAALDSSTASVTVRSWNPNVSKTSGSSNVQALAFSGTTVYAGGDFGLVNGSVTRNNAAAFDATGTVVSSWDPNLPAQVSAVAVSGSTVYLGGWFTGFVKAVDATTGTATGWNASLSPSSVNALAVSGSTVYTGGSFTSAGAVPGTAYYSAIPTTLPPVLASVSRSTFGPSGPTAGGGTLNLVGDSFVAGMTVTVGGAPCTSVTVTNATTASCPLPSGTAGARDVVVTTPAGSATLTGGFTYLAAPTVTAVSPSAGLLAGGTVLTLTGTGFFPWMSGKVGTVACVTFAWLSPTSAQCVTPAGAAGTVDVEVTTAGGTGAKVGGFTYGTSVPPTLSTVAPSSGLLAGGTTITLTGSNFIAGLTVTVGGNTCTSPTYVNATTATCVTPPGSAGAADVVMTTSGGSDTMVGGFTYVVVLPTVTFDANTGTGSMTPQVSAVPAVLDANAFTPPAGSVFVGWNTAANGSGTGYGAGSVYDFSVSITLYAQWVSTSSGEVVTFDANGGTGPAAYQQSASAAALTPNGFAMAGMVFAGWNTLVNGTGTPYADGELYAFTASTVLYAQWVSASPDEEERPLPPALFYSVLPVDGVCPDGWDGPSWQWWPGEGAGGLTCNLIIPWSRQLDTYAFDPALALAAARQWAADRGFVQERHLRG